MEIVSDDDDDDSLFDALMMVCQQESLSDSSGDEDEETGDPCVWGKSRQGRASNIERQRVFYSHLLFQDFWGPTPIYTPHYFKLFSSFQSSCLMRFWSVFSSTTTIYVKRKMLPARLDCQHTRKLLQRYAC